MPAGFPDLLVWSARGLSIPALIAALVTAGCSPKGENSATQSPPPVAQDLGKTEEIFRNLYGTPKAETHLVDFAFPFPSGGGAVKLTRPLIVQQYERDRLKTTVVLSETPRRALWVKYTLPDRWTQEQINAALKTYGSEWKIVEQNLAREFIMGDGASVVYRCSSGSLAYKTIVNELILQAAQLHTDLRGQIERLERQKQAVPKF